VVIPAAQSVIADTRTESDSVDVEALVIGGLNVKKGAALKVVGGTFELRGTTTVDGDLMVQAPGSSAGSSNTVNAEALEVDPAARALGLRDCAYTPIGFTPRLCGSGSVTVTASGSLTLDGLYASIFAAVHVMEGGVYTVRNGGHPWGLVTNEGLIQDDAGDSPYNPQPIYWHGMIDNRKGGVVNFTQTTVYYDEYSRNDTDGGAPEIFTKPTFTNAGVFNVKKNLISTLYQYAWLKGDDNYRGTYSPTVLNTVDGQFFSEPTFSSAIKAITNHGYLKLGAGTTVVTLVNDGKVESEGCWRVYTFNNTGSFEGAEACVVSVSDEPTPVLNNMEGGSVRVSGQYFSLSWAAWFLNNAGHAEISGMSVGASSGGESGLKLVNEASGVTWFSGSQSLVESVANSGTVYVNGTSVWFASQTCLSCKYYLLNDGELHLQISGASRPHRGLITGNTKAAKGTPQVCSGDACVSDPCPYAVEGTGSTCFTESGVPGVTYGNDLTTEPKHCYACSAAHPLGLIADETILERLAEEARSRGSKESKESDVPDAAELARRVFHFENAVVDGDGTGVLVSTSTVHLHGKKALHLRKGSMATILEGWQPVFVGGGELQLERSTSMHIGSEATLEDGGVISARPGSKVIVQSFSDVRARNHTLKMEPAAQLRIEGKLHLAPHSYLHTCAATVGRGTVVLDDPATAVKCEGQRWVLAAPNAPKAKAGSCAAVCTVDDDCSGECAVCGGGVCVEAGGCAFDADCGYSGQCVGGVCANCDSSLEHPPMTGSSCGSLKTAYASSFLTLHGQTVRQPIWEGHVPPKPSVSGTYIQEGVFTGTLQATYNNGKSACAFGSSYDKIMTSYDTPDTNHPTQGMVLKNARNFQSVGDGASAVAVFEYTYPNHDANCMWKDGVCQGTCSGGEKCASTGAADCGCPVKCGSSEPKVAAGGDKCASYIAAGNYSSRGAGDGIGDCTPGGVGCFCKRDGTQNVLGASGCPSYPAVALQSDGKVLLFYNTGSGDGIGLAKGPALGPWTVVKEPVLSGYKNPFVYTDGDVIHVLMDKIGEGNAPRHAATKDGGATWSVSATELLPLSTVMATKTRIVEDSQGKFTKKIESANKMELATRSQARVFPAKDQFDLNGWVIFSEVTLADNATAGVQTLVEMVDTAHFTQY